MAGCSKALLITADDDLMTNVVAKATHLWRTVQTRSVRAPSLLVLSGKRCFYSLSFPTILSTRCTQFLMGLNEMRITLYVLERCDSPEPPAQ